MQRKLRIFLAICFAPIMLFSQASIKGRVEDKSIPVSLANVLLLKSKDNTLIAAEITDTLGTFIFSSVRPGSYVLKFSRVGHVTYTSPPFSVIYKAEIVNHPVTQLPKQTDGLREVTVTGKRPFVEHKLDRMVVNVANSIIASGGTALEVLEKAPGISIDQQNDQITFKGKEGVIVQIDGRSTYLSMAEVVSLLRSMPSDNIDRIELITNPSSKYDAAGNSGIIDIRLKKNNNVGTNGMISLSGGSGKYGRKRGSVQINHRTSYMNLFGNYSINRDGNYWDFNLFRNQADGTERNLIDQLSFIRFKNAGHNAKAGVDLFLNKKTTVGMVWTGNWANNKEHSPAQSIFRRSLNADPYLQTLTNKSILNILSNHIINLNLSHSYSSRGQFTADVDYGRFRRTFKNLLNTQTIVPSSPSEEISTLLSYMPSSIDLITFKTDYSRTLAKKWKMEAGLKSSTVIADNNMQLSTGHSGQVEIDTMLSNHFKYKEQVFAGYMSMSGNLDKKTELLFGLRAEQTHSVANSINLKTVITKNYLKLFPSIFISRSINKNNSLILSYSYRIDRPNYQYLNPSRSYLDPYAYSAGNSFLTPQYTHSLEFKHGFKSKLYTSLGVSFIDDLMFFIFEPIDGKSSQRKPENIGSSQAYNLTVTFPVTVMKGWSLQTTLMGIYSTFSYVYRQTPIKVEQMSGRFNVSNAFVFGKGWSGEVSGRLNTPSVNALIRSPLLGSMDMGIQKSVSKRLKVKANLQDVFHTAYSRGRIDAADFKNNIKLNFDSRIFMVNLTYAFGNEQLKNSRIRKTASEEELKRAN